MNAPFWAGSSAYRKGSWLIGQEVDWDWVGSSAYRKGVEVGVGMGWDEVGIGIRMWIWDGWLPRAAQQSDRSESHALTCQSRRGQ